MNREVYFSGPNKVAEISKKLGVPTEVLWKCPCSEDVSLESLIELNGDYIEAFAHASKAFLWQFADYDIIVPWSGGKDSTAVLTWRRKRSERSRPSTSAWNTKCS